jgi:hypothetical protein
MPDTKFHIHMEPHSKLLYTLIFGWNIDNLSNNYQGTLNIYFSVEILQIYNPVWNLNTILLFNHLMLDLSTCQMRVVCSFTASLSLTLPPPDSGQYHNVVFWTIEHRVHLNVICYLSKYYRFDFKSFHRGLPRIFMNVRTWNIAFLAARYFNENFLLKLQYRYWFPVNFQPQCPLWYAAARASSRTLTSN